MDQLQHYLPHHIMLPPRRLQKLLKQAQLYQQSQSLCQMDSNATSLLYDAKPPQKEVEKIIIYFFINYLVDHLGYNFYFFYKNAPSSN